MKLSKFRIPKSIPFLGTRIAVRQLPASEMTADASWEYDAEGAAVIFIRKDLGIRRKRYLILHEMGHVILDLLHVGLDDNPDVMGLE